ncbi:hypothetical protein LC040_10150 [Bacillus tianshenii]|nr:hypothetical protein LC040_10150 [Bacillus tianshenii]
MVFILVSQELNKLVDKGYFDQKAIHISILGMGNLGFQAARYAYQQYNQLGFKEKGVEGLRVEFLEKEITPHDNQIKQVLKETDLLVDATKRPDSTLTIIPNEWIGYLPEEAIILDLTADPYEIRETGTQVKSIEGLAHGSLEKYIFHVDDKDWNEGIPEMIDTTHKRKTVSCNAWPGVMAKECMEVYGEKIFPFVELLITEGYQLNPNANDKYERALYRATIDYFEGNQIELIR